MRPDENLLRQAMEFAVEGAARLCENGRYTYANDRYAAMLGVQADRLLDTPWQATVHPDDIAMLEEAYREMCETGRATREARGIRPDGSIFPKRVTLIADRSDTGRLRGHYCFAQDLTHENRSLELSRRKQDWLDLTETVGKIGHWHVDLIAETVYWSDEVYTIHGRDRADYTPDLQTAINLYHPDDRDFVTEQVNAAIEDQRPFTFERRLVRPDGEIRWVWSRGECRLDAEGKPVAVFGLFRDITDERRASAFREKAFQILASPSDTSAGRITRVLDAACEYFDLERGYITRFDESGKAIVQMSASTAPDADGFSFEPAGIDCWNRIMDGKVRVYQHDTSQGHEHCFERCGFAAYIGAPLHVHGRRYGTVSLQSDSPRRQPFHPRDEVMIELVATWLAQEIEREAVITELRSSQERLELAVKGSGVGISDWQDITQDDVIWSDQHYRLLGYEPGEFPAKTSAYVKMLHPDDRDAILKTIDRHFRYREPYTAEARIRMKDGSYRWFMGTGQAVWDETGKPIRMIGTILDIHDRKQAETMKTEFVSTVSHELRTPLTSIMGVLGLVTSGRFGDLSDKSAQLLGIAKNSGERLVRLINDLLDIEKLESGQVAMTLVQQPLAPLVERALGECATSPDATGITLAFNDMSDGAECAIDTDRITQVVTNLLSNAVKFTPQGGRIDVTCERLDDKVRICVDDTGPGVPEEHLDRIFERFTQADSSDTRAKDGTGLGLAISKAIIDSHKGRLMVENRDGGGARFTVELNTVSARKRSGMMAARGPSTGPRLLYVEDDPDTASLIEHLLEEVALVDIATTGAEAKALLAELDYDLVLLDLELPDHPGQGVLDTLAGRKKASPPVLVYSIKEFEPSERWPFVRGAYVKSTISAEQLKSRIAKELIAATAGARSGPEM